MTRGFGCCLFLSKEEDVAQTSEGRVRPARRDHMAFRGRRDRRAKRDTGPAGSSTIRYFQRSSWDVWQRGGILYTLDLPAGSYLLSMTGTAAADNFSTLWASSASCSRVGSACGARWRTMVWPTLPWTYKRWWPKYCICGIAVSVGFL